MSTAQLQQKNVREFETLLEVLLDVWTKEELAGVTKTLGLQIRGFNKKIENAPVTSLQMKIRRAKKQFFQLENGFKKYYENEREKYTELDDQQFLLKVMQDETLSTAECLILTYYGLPNWYDEHIEKMRDNVKAGKPLFHKLIDKQGSREDWLYVLATEAEELSEALAQSLVASEEIHINLEQCSLEEWLQRAGHAESSENIQFILRSVDEWREWPIIEQMYLQKVLNASLLTRLETIQDKLTLHEKEKAELQEQLTKEQDRSHDLAAALDKKKKETFALKNEYEQTINDLNETIETLQEDKQSKQKELSQLHAYYKAEFAALKKELEEVEHTKQTSTHEPLFYGEAVWLVTDYEADRFSGYMLDEQIVPIEHFLQAQDKYRDQLLFIHTTGLSTSKQFELEDVARQVSPFTCFINGNEQAVVRKIAYYLEGEWKYEA
ncbi:hypothetical protein LC040_11550 [Bacillus tianshenii]|nr:hypothetical protein LC040_11550 [Bacillus tianshenii]